VTDVDHVVAVFEGLEARDRRAAPELRASPPAVAVEDVVVRVDDKARVGE